MDNPLSPFLARQGRLILDGGLATELEARGFDLSDDLWSARVLLRDPPAIRLIHSEYLEAGADCVVSATYQASLEGFMRHGVSPADARRRLLMAVELATSARDTFWAHRPPDRLRPLVAASIGPYGAYLADGSEYSGDYGLTTDDLVHFHRQRFALLAASGADLLACETIPSADEARALAQLVEATHGVWAWLAFSCRDGRRLADGTPIADLVAELDGVARLAAVGVNCTAPRHVDGLLDEIRRATSKPIVVYPNSGEVWDAASRSWRPSGERFELAAAGERWAAAGARLLGGCCRTGIADIRALRRRLLGAP